MKNTPLNYLVVSVVSIAGRRSAKSAKFSTKLEKVMFSVKFVASVPSAYSSF